MQVSEITAAPNSTDPRLAKRGAIGLRLRYARMIQGKSVKEVAKPLNVHPTTIGNWESGRCVIMGKAAAKDRAVVISKLAHYLHVHERWLETGQNPMAARAMNNLQDLDIDGVLESFKSHGGPHNGIGNKSGFKGPKVVIPKDETDPRLRGRDNMWLRFKYWRTVMEFSCKEAGETNGVAKSTFSRWETRPGRSSQVIVTAERVPELAEKMDVRVEWLLNGTLPMSSKVAHVDPAKKGPSGLIGADKMGARIKYARKQFTTLSAHGVGMALGYSSAACWQWENKATPRKAIVPAIAKLLTVTPLWLKFGEGVMRSEPKVQAEEPKVPEPEQETPRVVADKIIEKTLTKAEQDEILEQETPATRHYLDASDPLIKATLGREKIKPQVPEQLEAEIAGEVVDPAGLTDEESPAAKYFDKEPATNRTAAPTVIVQGDVAIHVKFVAQQLHQARQRLEQAENEVHTLTEELVNAIGVG